MIGKEEDNLLLDYLDPPDKKLAQFARGYILGSIMGLGNDWALRLIEVAKDWEVNKKAETLISLSSNEDTGH